MSGSPPPSFLAIGVVGHEPSRLDESSGNDANEHRGPPLLQCGLDESFPLGGHHGIEGNHCPSDTSRTDESDDILIACRNVDRLQRDTELPCGFHSLIHGDLHARVGRTEDQCRRETMRQDLPE